MVFVRTKRHPVPFSRARQASRNWLFPTTQPCCQLSEVSSMRRLYRLRTRFCTKFKTEGLSRRDLLTESFSTKKSRQLSDHLLVKSPLSSENSTWPCPSKPVILRPLRTRQLRCLKQCLCQGLRTRCTAWSVSRLPPRSLSQKCSILTLTGVAPWTAKSFHLKSLNLQKRASSLELCPASHRLPPQCARLAPLTSKVSAKSNQSNRNFRDLQFLTALLMLC